jgi:hypothetical protein
VSGVANIFFEEMRGILREKMEARNGEYGLPRS